MYIFGASGHGKVIERTLDKCNKTVKGFIDDNPETSIINNIPVINSRDIQLEKNDCLIIGIGDNLIRKNLVKRFSVSFFCVKHPSAQICNTSKIEEGTVIFANAVVNADTNIGKHCIVNSGAVVEHDCKLEDFVHVSPNATLTGGVSVGEGSHIGAGATIIPNVKIGKWAVIGAGSVITENVPDQVTIAGVPGKVIKRRFLD